MLNNITIIIPVYNEGENIGLLVNDIYSLYQGINILVIDDFSTDNTLNIVTSEMNIHKNLNIYTKSYLDGKGLTYSILKGINIVKTEYFIVMDGDFQHPIKSIVNFIKLFKLQSDIVIGERKKIIFNEKKYRIFISKIGNYLINCKIRNQGLYLRDPLSGFFGGKTIIFRNINIENKKHFLGKGYKYLFEFLKCIKKRKFNIKTFNYNFSKRKFGESKISLIIFIEFIKGIIS